MITVGTPLTPELLQTSIKNFCTPFTTVFVDLLYLHITLADWHRGPSLSTTLVSRSMLRLRSEDSRHHHDSHVTEQTSDVRFVPTLSELSGLSIVPVVMAGHDDEKIWGRSDYETRSM